MREGEMRSIAGLMDAVLRAPDSEAARQATAAELRDLTAAFPLYAPQPAEP
jgi:glycine/serine hydroxymethyltransferase